MGRGASSAVAAGRLRFGRPAVSCVTFLCAGGGAEGHCCCPRRCRGRVFDAATFGTAPFPESQNERHAKGLIEPACRRSPSSATLLVKEGAAPHLRRDGRAASGCIRSAATRAAGTPARDAGTSGAAAVAAAHCRPQQHCAAWLRPCVRLGAGPCFGCGPIAIPFLARAAVHA